MQSVLKGLPMEGAYFDWKEFRFEVMDMDGFRVDKVLVSAIVENEHGDSKS